ncbi:MAG TPA: potassium channel family protein [Candidatus Tyrphobacter sp.]
MRLADVAVLVAGIAAIIFALVDVFQSVILPRAPMFTYRISFALWRSLWMLWPPIARRIHPRDSSNREDFLATFAPFALIAMLLAWVTVLVLGYGAVLWALRAQVAPPLQSYWDAAYFAGTSLLTIGYGDIVARHGAARLVALCAGASGLGVVSITTAFLFAIFGTFQRREAFIVALSARTGSPPSGTGLFEVAAKTKTLDGLGAVMKDAQNWIAALMESHLAYPVLAYFRSSHDDESWVGTLGALMDAASLATTTLDIPCHGEARICFAIGRHAVHDLGRFFRRGPVPDEGPGITRQEFELACDRLVSCGCAIRDRDAAWQDFAKARAEYAAPLNAMARFFQIPPVQWIGERGPLSPYH